MTCVVMWCVVFAVEGVQNNWAFGSDAQFACAASLPDAHLGSGPHHSQVALLVLCDAAEKDEEDLWRDRLHSGGLLLLPVISFVTSGWMERGSIVLLPPSRFKFREKEQTCTKVILTGLL